MGNERYVGFFFKEEEKFFLGWGGGIDREEYCLDLLWVGEVEFGG